MFEFLESLLNPEDEIVLFHKDDAFNRDLDIIFEIENESTRASDVPEEKSFFDFDLSFDIDLDIMGCNVLELVL